MRLGVAATRTCNVRHAERWDYAHDEVEPAPLRRAGVDVAAIDGGSI